MITLAEQITCVEREIKMRRRVYSRQTEKGHMNPHAAQYEINAMEAVLATLQKVDEKERLI